MESYLIHFRAVCADKGLRPDVAEAIARVNACDLYKDDADLRLIIEAVKTAAIVEEVVESGTIIDFKGVLTKDDIPALGGHFAGLLTQERKAPPGTILVSILGWDKFEGGRLIAPGGGRIQ